MASLIVKITGDASGFKSTIDSIGRSLDSLSVKTERVGGSLTSLGSTLSVGLSAPILALGTGAIKASADIDTLRKALVSTTGSAGEAAKQFARLEEIAKLPAIGLQEAVRGSIRLQNYGLSAALAEKAMRGFSNAIGASGGSADDTSEALRQLGQMFGRQKVTMDNLRIILERVPQAAKIIREEFGSEALADPAKALEKLGVNSEQFITVLINRLADAQKVAPGLKTEIENLGQEFQKTAAVIGDQLKPAVIDLMGAMSDGLKIAADYAKKFGEMPKPIQNIGLALTALAVAAPIAITALGTVITNFGVISTAAGGIATAVAGFGTTIATYGAATSAAIGIMAGAWVAAAAVAVYSVASLTSALYEYYAASEKVSRANGDLAFSIDKLLERVRKQHPEIGALELRYRNGSVSAEDFAAELRRLAAGMESTTVQTAKAAPGIRNLGEEHKKAAGHTEKHTKALSDLGIKTFDVAMAAQLKTERQKENNDAVDKAVEISRRYNATTAEQARLNVQVADSLFRYFRVLEQAPDMGGITAGIKVPTFKQPKFGDKPFEGGAPNVGDGGMMTREQAEAIKGRYKDIGKVGQAATRQVSLVMNDLARGITDVIFKGGKLGDMLQSVASQAAQSITRLLIEGALKKLTDSLLGVGKTASGVFGSIFGSGSNGASPIFSAVGGGASAAAGGVSSAAGSAASAGISGIVGMATGIVSAVSGVIGNFQFMAMNKSLDLIEHEVRYSQIHLLNTLNKANEYWPYMKNCWESLVRMEQRGGGLAGGSVNVNMAGAYLLTDSALDDFIERIARQLKTQGI